jgi:serine/threonine protein kinase
LSIDGGARISAARARATATQVGYTLGYDAPELLLSGASKASDVYALGATIAEVAPPSTERDELAKRMQVAEPGAIPMSPKILQDLGPMDPTLPHPPTKQKVCCPILQLRGF